jgi:HSP20 family protein
MPKNRSINALSLVHTPTVVSMSETESLFENSVRELHNAITQRAHELWQHSGFTFGHDIDDWLRAESELLRFAPVEITESEDELKVYAELPGLNARDIEIHLEPKRLIIRGKTEQTHEKTKGHVSYSEREGTQVFRALTLPTEVDSNNASAVLRDGILELTLPKADTAKGTRVQVKAA